MSNAKRQMSKPARPARIGIIGTGWWAAVNHIPSLIAMEDAELVAICSKDPDAIVKIQSQFGAIPAFDDHKEMLRNVKLDGVIVSSPHGLHYEHAKAALEAGCHVLVEKPFTTDVAQAGELIRLSEQKGLTLSVSYGWNYIPLTRNARALIRKGYIGKVQHVILQMASPTSDLFSGKDFVLTEGHLVRPQRSTWSDPAKAGGYGWGQLSHIFGLFGILFDEEPAEVFAMTALSEAGVDYYDAICLRFKSGATGVISGSSNMPSVMKFQVEMRVFGSRGNFFMDLEPGRERVVVETMAGEIHDLGVKPGDGGYDGAGPVRHLVAACRGNAAEDMAPAIVGARSVALIEAMHRSAASGKVEKVRHD